MRIVKKGLLFLYAAIAISTFGASADNHSRYAWARYAACYSVAINIPDGDPSRCHEPWVFEAVIVGLLSAPVWPLWWSWEITAKINEEARS